MLENIWGCQKIKNIKFRHNWCTEEICYKSDELKKLKRVWL